MEEKNRQNPFWNARLPIEERLDWLLANMTLEEKITCMASTMPELPRFGIDMSYVGGEAAHGVEARNDQNGRNIPEPTTSFPQPIGMSASWDTELIKKAGEVTGTEARVLWHRHPAGGLSRWAPTVDLERDPRWGRNEEGYGEDPVLTGAMAGAYIEGMQGDDPNYLRIAATLKHFYANNTERGRGWKNASIDPRNMYELYLEPFRRCIKEHGAEAVMTAYNKINGIPGMLNPQVKSILKKQYGLKHAVCDGGAMELVRNLHHYFGTHAQSLAASVKAGVDAMSDPMPVVEEAAREALEYGLLSEDEMDEAIRNVFRTKLKLGMFDDIVQNPYDRVTEKDLCSSQAQKVCLELTKKSIVLLKNEDNRLPLSETLHKDPVLVGPLCDAWYQDWYGGEPHHKSTLKEGLEKLLNTKIRCVDGWDRITLRAGDQYVAVQEDGTLCLSDKADLFVKEDWGDGRINLRCERTGKYVTTISKVRCQSEEEDGALVAVKDAAFDWFVTAIFHIIPAENGAVRLTNRFDQPIQISKDKNFILH
ncbi:MAG: glycoside hydrolase family 3 N-terminal domain-containing protein [Lachnospiraceae bacterium]